MSKSDLRIDILGTEITISTDEEPEYLNMLLDKYRQTIENVRRKSDLKDPLKVAVLTGFLLCDDLEKAGKGEVKNKTTGEAEALTLGMISRLDEVLEVADTAVSECAVTGAADTITGAADTEPVYDTEPEPVYVLKLENTVKHYDWGSPEWLPAFLGRKNPSRIPWAELWLGVHPSGPSRVLPNSCPLSELIGRNPAAFLGKETSGKYGTLPFLLKIITAAKPLSIQVHPNAEQAREGFERENMKGIPLDAADRNYKDPNLKSEMLCALGPFAALCGFRKVEEITLLMDILLLNSGVEGSGLRETIENLVLILKKDGDSLGNNPGNSPGGSALKNFLSTLFAINNETLLAIGSFIKDIQRQLERDFPEYKDEWYLCAYLATLYPGDPGILAPLYLNILDLEQGEAIFIPAGTPHSYINGMGIELLSDSDNVLRGGLTSKHVDHEELMKIMNFSDFMPEILRPPETSPTTLPSPTALPSETEFPHSLHSYPAGEFALTVMRGSGTRIQYTDPGPSILIVTEGVTTVDNGDSEMPLKKGESAFIPAGKKAAFSGTFTAYIASCRYL